MILSNDTGLTDHLVCMAFKIVGVMGSLTLLPLGAECRIPFKTYVSWGRDGRSKSSSLRQSGKTCMHSDTRTQSEGTKID